MNDIETQPEPEHLALAADALEAVALGDLDVPARLAIGFALATLNDVHPPYPPRPEPSTALPLASGVRLALRRLTDAVHAAGTVQEATRAGMAARYLHPLRDQS